MLGLLAFNPVVKAQTEQTPATETAATESPAPGEAVVTESPAPGEAVVTESPALGEAVATESQTTEESTPSETTVIQETQTEEVTAPDASESPASQEELVVVEQTGDTANQAIGAAGAVGGLVAIIVFLLIFIVLIVSVWKVFVKAGKPGWASLIPIYNIVVYCEICGKPVWWVILFFIPFVNFFVAIILVVSIAKAFGKGTGFAIGLILLPIIFFPVLAFGDAEYMGA